MKILCDKCKKSFETSNKNYWQSGEKFEGIDEHHNPPEEISRFLKEKWSGELFNLCRSCHKKLHIKITSILKKYSRNPHYNSDYWLMQYSTPKEIKEAEKEIYNFTKKWIKEEDDTKKTPS